MKLVQRVTLGWLAVAAPLICAAADNPRHAFECDTPAGHFSYWNRSVSSREIEITGKVTVNETLKDKKWSPAVAMLFRGGKDQSAPFGLRIFAIVKTPDMLFTELLKVGGRDPIGLGGVLPRTRNPIPFKLKLDATGLLKVEVAGIEASTQLGDFKPESFELSCSTGDYEFTDVTVTER
jgi:hypothetical protein